MAAVALGLLTLVIYVLLGSIVFMTLGKWIFRLFGRYIVLRDYFAGDRRSARSGTPVARLVWVVSEVSFLFQTYFIFHAHDVGGHG